MLTCVYCDAPETLGSPFIDGVCFDCLRKETMAAHPAERTRVFLAGIDRTQLARPSSESAAPAEAEAEEVQTPGRRPARLPKLHVRDFFWFTLLIAIGLKAYEDREASATAREETQSLISHLSSVNSQRHELQTEIDNLKAEIYIQQIEAARERQWQATRIKTTDKITLFKANQRDAYRDEVARLGLEIVDVAAERVELRVPGHSSEWTFHEAKETAKYYPED